MSDESSTADERRPRKEPRATTGPGAERPGDRRGLGTGSGSEGSPTATRRHLARSTTVFAAATGLSRVLGLAREMVEAYVFGARGLVNAFTVAFQIPNLIRALVADAALSGAFVPVFSELLGQDRRRAWRVASTIFWLFLLGLGALVALLILLAPLLIRPFGNPGGDLDLAVGLSRVLFPIVLLLGLSGIVVGILNAHDRFALASLTPVAWNVVIILGLALGVPVVDGTRAELYVYAGSILVATLVQLLMPLPALRGLDGRIRPVLDWRDPAVRRFFALMLPVTLTLGLINVSAVIGTLFASRLIDPELAPQAINKAFRLYMLPQGMFSVAVATVLFPTLSRLAARGDVPAFRRTMDDGVRLIGFLLIPASLVSAALAVPITRIVYERGAFTADDTTVVAQCLAAFSVGLAFNGWMLMLTRGFYALQANWAPTIVALGSLALNVLLNVGLYRVGVWGLPLATGLANVVAVGALVWLLRERTGRENPSATLGALARIALASIPATAVAFACWWALDALAGRSLPGQVVSVGGGLAAGVAAYVAGCRILRVRELDALRILTRRRPD
jgi:putative peptidoglycan lipid II flippase